jgi:hypothetical protein
MPFLTKKQRFEKWEKIQKDRKRCLDYHERISTLVACQKKKKHKGEHRVVIFW